MFAPINPSGNTEDGVSGTDSVVELIMSAVIREYSSNLKMVKNC